MVCQYLFTYPSLHSSVYPSITSAKLCPIHLFSSISPFIYWTIDPSIHFEMKSSDCENVNINNTFVWNSYSPFRNIAYCVAYRFLHSSSSPFFTLKPGVNADMWNKRVLHPPPSVFSLLPVGAVIDFMFVSLLISLPVADGSSRRRARDMSYNPISCSGSDCTDDLIKGNNEHFI